MDVSCGRYQPVRHERRRASCGKSDSSFAEFGLVFFTVRSLTGAVWKSALVAAIFAAHPAHVESVAWVAERKDVLSTAFWLGSTLLYVAYVRSKERTNLFVGSLVLFALGLASKPMLVTMPFTLLLFDLWPLRRAENWNAASLWALVRGKLAYFVLSAASIVITLLAQGTSGAIQTMERFQMSDRIANAIVAYVKYIGTFFLPMDLAAWYPFEAGLPIGLVAGSFALLILITAACIWQMRERAYLLVGWLWFLGTLLPVIGIVQVGRQSMADRYTYVPYIGLAIAVVWLAAELAERVSLDKRVAAAVCGIIVLALSASAYVQASYWKDSETLFKRTLAVTERNYFIEHNYCYYLQQRDRLNEALQHCAEALEHDPNLAEAHNTLGTIYLKQQRFADAKQRFQRAIELRPNYSQAYANAALTSAGEGDFTTAAALLEIGRANDGDGFFTGPTSLEIYVKIGNEAMRQKQYPAAIGLFQNALVLQPKAPDVERNLALAHHLSGNSAEGIRVLETALKGGTATPEMHNSLGLIYGETGRRQEAVQQFQRALQLNPNFEPARNNLRVATGQ
jgi:protein O-mannosyl-transferase